MIFKYYTWNKIFNTWHDTQIYCSVCSSKAIDRVSLTEHVHNILSKRNLISLPKGSLSVVDRSQHHTASYHLFTVIAGRNVNFGKLDEIPNKDSGFAKKIKPDNANDILEILQRPIRYQFVIDDVRAAGAAMPVPAAPIPDLIPTIPAPQRIRGRIANPVEDQPAEFYPDDEELF